MELRDSRLFSRVRSARTAERQAHRGSAGDGPSLSGAAAEDQPPRLAAALRQGSAEDDGPAAAGDQPRPADPADEGDGGGLVLTPAPAGDHEGLVLVRSCTATDRETSRERRVVSAATGGTTVKMFFSR